MNLSEVHDIADAVLLTWYPGEEGGNAVADIIFGKVSPSGRLPITFPKSLDQLPAYEDYSMKGRTYRYMIKEPMYPFGFGLSYGSFKYSGIKLSASEIREGETVQVWCNVSNEGKYASTETVQLYISDDKASVDVPLFSLKGIETINLKPGESTEVVFNITTQMLELINNQGQTVLEKGDFTISIAGSLPTQRATELGASIPLKAQLKLL
jgi:beta-glucosidase